MDLTLKMTSAQVVETSVTNNSPFQDYPNSVSGDHTRQTIFNFLLGVWKSNETLPHDISNFLQSENLTNLKPVQGCDFVKADVKILQEELP